MIASRLGHVPLVGGGGAHLNVIGAAETVIVAQAGGSRGVFVEPERNLRLDTGSESVVPSGRVGRTG